MHFFLRVDKPFSLLPSRLGGARPGQRGGQGAARLTPRGGHGRPDKLRGGPPPLPFWEGRRAPPLPKREGRRASVSAGRIVPDHIVWGQPGRVRAQSGS